VTCSDPRSCKTIIRHDTEHLDQNQLSTTSTIRKVCLLDADVVFCVVWMLYLRCRHQLDLSATIGCIVRIYTLSDLQTGDVVPCDPIARAFEEKDGFLVSGSPILLHDNYVLHQTRTIQQITDVRFWEKFELTGFHFA